MLTGSLSIFILCMSVCLFVSLYPINVKTAEAIGPIFCIESDMTQGKVYVGSKLQRFVFKICLIFVKFEDAQKIL